MSAETVTVLRCDALGCATTLRCVGSVVATRERGEGEGWDRRHAQGFMVDLCPEHARAPKSTKVVGRGGEIVELPKSRWADYPRRPKQ